MTPVLAIAGNEARRLLRSRVALTGLLMTLLLTLASAVTSAAYYADQDSLRARLQAQANDDFTSQPDRHPHRVVHFGHFAVRPPGGLAAFDPGIEAFTGNMVFLEGHRQNSANFGDARQSSLLMRFGQLSPAFMLQTVAPLLLVFLGAGMVAGERERGSLRQSILAGARGRDVLAGKMLALGAAGVVMLTPAIGLLVALGLLGKASLTPSLLIVVGYVIYLMFWAVLAVLVSAFSPGARTALIALTAAWAFAVILVPRLAPEIASGMTPLATRLETDVAIQRDLRAMGDSHDPNDPHFEAFKRATLKRYGVDRVEDLPLNYKGLLGMEGERLTSSLFDRYAERSFSAMSVQSRAMDLAAMASPLPALRRLSMAAAGTDLTAYRAFQEQAERYRYALIQRLNRLQAERVTFADDSTKDVDAASEARSRVSANNWRSAPVFHYAPPPVLEAVGRAFGSLLALLVWLCGALLLTQTAARRLQRSAS